MATARVGDLSEVQLLILSALWAKGDATIAEINALIEDRAKVTPKSVATILGRLEVRKLVSHELRGRESYYAARITRRDVLVSRVGAAIGALFALDAPVVGAAAVRKRDQRPDDAEQLRALLRRADRDLRGKEK